MKYRFETMHGEYTIEEARQEAGEYSREAHDLCCWPIEAARERGKANAIYAEIKSIREREGIPA